MNRRRLSAEMLRDSMLAVSGELETAGDSKSMKVSDPKNLRRTIYSRISRKELDSFLRQFDYPDANVHAEGRVATITATQKLYLLNSPFVSARAARLAKEVAGDDLNQGVERLFRRVLSRAPANYERARALRYFDGSAESRDWEGFAQVLLCSNAFLYRD